MGNLLWRHYGASGVIVILGFLLGAAGANESDTAVQELDLNMLAGNDRNIPVRIFAPAGGCDPCTLVVFSHGAYSTYDRYDRLLHGWARAGFVIAAPLHVDSELHPDRDQYAQEAALGTRVEDYLSVRNALIDVRRIRALDVVLSGHVVAAGHSFGALIAQLAGGANPPTVSAAQLAELAETPPMAIIALSPPPAMPGYIEESHWARVSMPMLVVTGTSDVIPNFVTDWRQHLDSFKAAPDENAYALIFDGADHYFNGAFGRPTLEGERMAPIVSQLNQGVVDFIDAVQTGLSPPQTAWWQALPASVRTLENGDVVLDE